MAELKVYRAAYIIDDAEPPVVYYTEYVTLGGKDAVIAELASRDDTQPDGVVGGSVSIVGWEAKKLDTEP